ncbi:MAG: hypothetical protein WDZ37_05620 [Solirubrobacterales bacterium]
MSAAALVISALVALFLVVYVGAGAARARVARREGRPRSDKSPRIDPGVERRAERKARALLRSVVNAEEWEMYRDLGFVRVAGRMIDDRDGGYCYLVYPHRPIVAYLPESSGLLSEYCVQFPDRGGRFGPRLPDSDDVLAKWMMIKADEERLLRGANMHLPGRQVDPEQVRRDLARLREWERARGERAARDHQGTTSSTVATGTA